MKMKIQCDVCSKEEATVFCTADEAALCDGCDRRVHHANKLASKHPRFSLLLHPSPSSPLCDICQEKRAFLFCQQDRAILCRECDVPIHTVNDLTLKHDRFLLTGVKLSSTPSPYSVDSGDLVPNYSSSPAAAANIKSPQPPPPHANKTNSSTSTTTAGCSDHHYSNSNCNSNNNSQQPIALINNCSTISEYLMEMLPGWHVEDLLEATHPASTPFGFSKVDGGLLSFGETDGEADSNISNSSASSSASERLSNWVPQAPAAASFLHPQFPGFNNNKQALGGSTNNNKQAFGNNYSFGDNRRWTTEDLFAVPQISPSSSSGVRSKRAKPF